MPEPVAQRIVPGAPPPLPLSKTQKKRRKAKAKSDSPEDNHVVPDVTVAALIEKAPEPAELQQGALAPELVAHDSRAPSILEEDSLLKNSPIVELVTKRFKATNKKITRITGYAAMDAEKLNDDQKRTLKTLPTLEAVQKELGEVKKAIEVHEAELAHELAAKRAEVEKAEKARIQTAVAAAQSTILSKTGDILNLLRFRSSLANGEIDTSALSMQGTEATAIYAAADALLGEDGDRKQAVISGFLLSDSEGDLDGVPYSRLIEITTAALNPPREPTPEPEEEQEPAVTTNMTDEVPSTASITGPSESEAPVNITTGVPGPIAASNSFRFMQDSELEGPFDETPADVPQEIVNPQEHVPVEGDQESEPEQAPVNGHADEGSVPVTADAPGTIDWAAEENAELPSIAGLHAEFGTSGSATPADTQPAQQQEQEQLTAVDGDAASPPTPPQARADDGFQPAGGRGHHRGRGFRGGPDDRRGRGGFRGGYRGHGERGGGPGGERGFRGGYRGGDRGGRGGFRGRGEYRGEGRSGYRGDGEYRGEGRGGYRGDGEYRGEGRGGYRGDGEYRGEGRGGYRGDGERRGGGRGRSRGDYRGGPPREGAPSGAAAAAAAPASPAPAAA